MGQNTHSSYLTYITVIFTVGHSYVNIYCNTPGLDLYPLEMLSVNKEVLLINPNLDHIEPTLRIMSLNRGGEIFFVRSEPRRTLRLSPPTQDTLY